jgi:hypothetical protein
MDKIYTIITKGFKGKRELGAHCQKDRLKNNGFNVVERVK